MIGRRAWRLVVGVVAAGGALCAARSVHAQASPSAQVPAQLGIRFPNCPKMSWDDVLAALRTELGHDGVRRVESIGERPDVPLAWIEVLADCTTPVRHLVVRVHDPRARDASRSTDLSDLPPSLRPRGIALAVAELARAVWTRPDETAPSSVSQMPTPSPQPGSVGASPPSGSQQPAPAPVPTAASAPPAPPAPVTVVTESARAGGSEREQVTERAGREGSAPMIPGAQRLELSAAFVSRWFFDDPTNLIGGRAGIRVRRLRVGIEALEGSHDDRLGSLTFDTAAAFLGVDALVHEGSWWTVRAGPRLAAGLARATAAPLDAVAAEPASELYLDVALYGEVAVRLAGGWQATLQIDNGWARGLTTYAGVRRSGAVDGVFLGGQLGLAWQP